MGEARKVIVDFQSLGPQPLAKNAVLGTAEEIFVLDNAFALIEGHHRAVIPVLFEQQIPHRQSGFGMTSM